MLGGTMNELPDFEDYEVIIVQQPDGPNWNKKIQDWQSNGIKVLYETDDFVQGIKKIEGHRFRHKFHKKACKEIQKTMSLCDGMICSTKFLSDQYSKYNPNQFVCRVGIDTERYTNIEFPPRDKFVVGWAGGTGHNQAIIPWLGEVYKLLKLYDDLYFVTLGVPYADVLASEFPGKALSVPGIAVENYPYALTNLDCFLAPSHESKYFSSKSDLRWLEGSAVGIPGVVDPRTYLEAQDGSTALLATTPAEAGDAIMELKEDKELRKRIGENAQEYVCTYRDMENMAGQWEEAISSI